MTQTKRYKRYSPEFKREALLRTSEEGITDKQVCEELGISARQLARWRDELRLLGYQAFPGRVHRRDEELLQRMYRRSVGRQTGREVRNHPRHVHVVDSAAVAQQVDSTGHRRGPPVHGKQ